jgi:GDPmannose 4,6-dehydratase
MAAMTDVIARVRPREIYHLAALSSGAGMWDDPVMLGDINGLAVARLLDSVHRTDPTIRVVQAGSSEMFGDAATSPQNETTSFRPRSPYGAAKVFAHHMVGHYRKRHGLFACSAILYNHESPLRRAEFVTRKITRAAAHIALGWAQNVTVGSLSARRDWGFAGDTARAMMLMAQADAPDDYVIATGVTHTIEDLCRIAFERVGLDWRDYVRVDASDAHVHETVHLVGDAQRAREQLGWRPEINFSQLIHMMVDADLAWATNERTTDE